MRLPADPHNRRARAALARAVPSRGDTAASRVFLARKAANSFHGPTRIRLIFTVLGISFVVSIAGFALLYVVLGREPAVPGNSVLVLRLGGDLAEVESGDRRRLPARRKNVDGPHHRR